MNSKRMHSHTTKALRIGIVCGVVVAGVGLGLLGFVEIYAQKIYPFISIQGVSVGGLTREQAVVALKGSYPDTRTVAFITADTSITATAYDLAYTIDYTTAVDNAFP